MSEYTYKCPAIRSDIMIYGTPEDLKRLEIVRKLSSDFTTYNKVGAQLDDALARKMELVKDSYEPNKPTSNPSPASPKTATKPKAKTTSSTNNKDLDSIKDGMLSLFDDLQSLAEKGGSTSAANFTGKIGFNQLDTDLQERFGKVQIIQYQVAGQNPGPKVTKSLIPAFQKIIDDIVLGQNVFLVGGAGTGKTTLAQNAAEVLGREYMTINCSQWTAPTEIIGGQTLDGYQEGKLIEAWKNGYILILDELPKIDPNTAGLFNDALAKSKLPNALIFNSRKEHFKKHPNFAVVATGNVWPIAESMAYGANNKQDLSLLDRFAGSVYFIEKNPELEQSVVGSLLLWKLCSELRRVVEELRYEAQVSMRFMMTCRDTLMMEMSRLNGNGMLADDGKTLSDCFESFIASNFTEVQQKTIKDKFNIMLINNTYLDFTYITGKHYRGDSDIYTSEFTSAGYMNSNGLSGFTVNRRFLDGF